MALKQLSDYQYSQLQKYYPFQSCYLKLKSGHYYHYIDQGPRQDEALLLVHGNPSWSFLYRHVIQKFQSQMRVIAMDHLGHGLSENDPDYQPSLAEHQQNLVQLIDHLQLKKVILVVHDWGGPIGLGACLQRKGLLKGLVVSNTAVFLSPNIPWRIWLCRLRFLNHLLVGRLNLFARAATVMATTKPLGRDLKYWYLYPYQRKDCREGVKKFILDIPLKSEDENYSLLDKLSKQVQSLKVPVLLLWGGKDFCFDQTFYQRFCEYFPSCEKHLFAHAGHFVWEDEKQQCLELLEKWLGRLG